MRKHVKIKHRASLIHQQIMSCKWIIRCKFDFSRSIIRYKAGLVTHSFLQVLGIDFKETFSLVLLVSLQLMLALSVALDLELYHVDVQTTFLHGKLTKELN